MKTLVVISHDSRFADALGIGLDPLVYRVRPFGELMTAVEAVAGGVVDGVLLDGDSAEADLAAVVASVRAGFPAAQVVVVADGRDERWQEDVLRAGASQVFARGLNPAVLAAWQSNQPELGMPQPAVAAPVAPGAGFAPLEAISELSQILSHSLEPDALAREFMLHVRRIIGVNRVSLFLRSEDDEAELACAFTVGRRPSPDTGFPYSRASADS